MFHRDFLAPSGSGLGFRGLSPFFSFVSFLRNGAPHEFFLRMNVVEHGLLLFGVYAGVIFWKATG